MSEVIRIVYATKSWDGVDPAIVENARIRGTLVDHYMSTYIRDGSVIIEGESADVTNRIKVAHYFYESLFFAMPAEAQVIVYSLTDGVAGTMDVWVDHKIIVDIKSTYSIEHSWVLQLGAYAEYAPIAPERAGIIHISPKTYKNGGKWLEYDVERCRRYWRNAVAWWKESQTLKTAMKR